MHMTRSPRPADFRQGTRWLFAGLDLVRRRPFAWLGALMGYWLVLVLFSVVPLIGWFIPLLLSPGLSFGFVLLSQRIAKNASPLETGPMILTEGFKNGNLGPLLRMGLLQSVALTLLGLLVFGVMGGGEAMNAAPAAPGGIGPTGEAVPPEAVPGGGLGLNYLLVGALGYLPILMAFWFSPQFVVWGKAKPLQAVFFSVSAVWLRKEAFLGYALSWLAVVFILSGSIMLILGMLDIPFQAALVALIPASLMLMAVGHASAYVSTEALFGEVPASKPDRETSEI